MNITINKEVFEKLHPKLKVAFISVKDINNTEKLDEVLLLLKEVEEYIRFTYNKDTLKNHHMVSSWAMMEERQLSKVKHQHSSLERIFHRVLDRREIAVKNVVQNLAYYLSLKNIIPMAVDDSDKLKGNLSVRLAKGTEKDSLRKGTLIYCDSAREGKVLGSKLDLWKSPRTRVTPQSKNVLLHIEALPPITSKQFNQIVSESVGLLRSFTGGRVKKIVLSKGKNSGEI
ncbi:MAG: phenylalanine--tRNA ligase beta subunit-related protein [archaeon]|nr:hypothetical protein [Nanoarchaeota archaeon]